MRSRISMPEQLAQEFRRRIATGQYPMNSFLPSERELAKEFGTSRDTIAAALAFLTAEGLADRCRGRGTRIVHSSSPNSLPIGCIVGEPFRTNWPESLRSFEGIQATFIRLGYKYELIGIEPSPGKWPLLSTEEIHSRLSGVIYLETANCDEQIVELHNEGFPVVVANLEIDLDVTCTWVDHKKTTTEAVRMLAGFGHKRIAYIGRESTAYFYGKAIEGYRIGLAEAGIECDESLIGVVDETSPLVAYMKMRDLLSLPNPPTAVVAGRDLFAEGACMAAQERGLVIGRDFSIIGYDDITWQKKEPFLTTFREPCYELGKAAAELFIEKLIGGVRETVKREVISPMIIRKSAGPLIT